MKSPVRTSIYVIATGAALLAMTACGDPTRRSLIDNAAFWQRANVSEAAFMSGPKAQQMLHRDIARCTTELRELEQLGTIRNAMPMERGRSYRDPQSPEGQLSKWETPPRDGYLLNEHGNYHDFETCMIEKGWERIEHVPYDTAHRSRRNYTETIIGQRYQSKIAPHEPVFNTKRSSSDPAANLND